MSELVVPQAKELASKDTPFDSRNPSVYRNKQGGLITRGLFHGVPSLHDISQCIYTFRDYDHDGYLSLRRRYLDLEDLTEYEFANKYFESYEHWQLVADASWAREYIAKWRTELEIRLKAKALRAILDEAELGGKNSFQANKYILEKGWVSERIGRPSKQKIKEEALELARSNYQINKDLERLGVNPKEIN